MGSRAAESRITAAGETVNDLYAARLLYNQATLTVAHQRTTPPATKPARDRVVPPVGHGAIVRTARPTYTDIREDTAG